MEKLDSIDRKLSGIIHKWSWGYFDIFVLLPATIFGVWGVPLLIIWWFYKYQSPLFLIAVIIVLSINETLKYVIGRPRPSIENIAKKWPNLRGVHNNPSMPSGDTAQASVAAVTLIYHGFSGWFALAIPLGALEEYIMDHIGLVIVLSVQQLVQYYHTHKLLSLYTT